MRARPDVVALVAGVVLIGVAGAVLWNSLVAPLTWSLIRIIAPLVLVGVGLAGLALSRNRS